MVSDVSSDVAGLVEAMTVDEKASLTAGIGLWYLPAVERLGVPALKVSDGPSGVRGDSLIGRRSLSLPCGTLIGSTWNPDLVRQLGAVLADEARDKGVHVLLGPTVCIVRTPLAGRTFESFSEDPLLTARLAVAYVSGVQGGGVACCIKHFACNDQEFERHTISADVDERTLHEIHLPAFEAAVKEAGVWAVMTAYNKLNGVYCGEQADLLSGVLRDDWGFDGLVMSDWFGTHSTVEAAVAGLDLEMPGPSAWLGPSLAAAVKAGDVDEPVLDDKVRHLLGLMERVGILGGDPVAGRAELENDDPDRRAVAQRVVAQGTVLLHNDGVLPLSPDAIRSVAVIGPNAGALEAGGGSSEVTPHRRRRVFETIAERLPGATVVHEVGCRINRELPSLDLSLVTGGALSIEYFDNNSLSGPPIGTDAAYRPRLIWVGEVQPGLPSNRASVRVRADFTPDVGGPWRLGLESAGRSLLRVGGEVAVDNTEPKRGVGFFGAGSAVVEATVELVAGRSYVLEAEVWPRSASSPILGVRIGADPPQLADEFERAVAAAAAADVAIVVVGSNGAWESEGFDRPDLSLPGEQRQLIEAVVAANPRTVVVVNAGSPVEMPWATSAAAVLMAWYPGEVGADVIADLLVGRAEPSGRLPVSFPKRIEDTSAFGFYPGADGHVAYGEGVFVGYRHLSTRRIEPQFPFGHGLSYTTFDYGDVEVGRVGAGSSEVQVPVTNTGERDGHEVVQVYLQGSGEQTERTLVGFAKVQVAAGEQSVVAVTVSDDALGHWDVGTHGRVTEPGTYTLLVGASSLDIRVTTELTVP
ncbi:MAG TPA: glycoside hydrolase family 3 C-terminal domain-containing protein [Acidimicrobiales bacterium]|jgi:beta-glucosidase|nr:glycoside hydrolase family 3 C-terminal domain-containing protein [Acidimicrobiales bacterium]